jgi:hypothetical protein
VLRSAAPYLHIKPSCCRVFALLIRHSLCFLYQRDGPPRGDRPPGRFGGDREGYRGAPGGRGGGFGGDKVRKRIGLDFFLQPSSCVQLSRQFQPLYDVCQ